MKKFRNLFLCLLLCLCCGLTAFGLAGCGKVKIGTLKSNFEKLDATYKANSDIFTINSATNDEFYILINYGGTRIENNKDFPELKDVYNATLVMASQYVDNNREYVLNYEGKLSKKSQKALENLNESLTSYIKSVKAFVKEHATLVSYCNTITDTTGDEEAVYKFEKSYGKMVNRCVNLSTNMANFIETTEILSLLKKTTPTAADTETVKQYIRAKLLPIFSDFKIAQMGSMNWSQVKTGDAKTLIDDLIKGLDTAFEDFKTIFVRSTGSQELAGGSEAMNKLFDLTELFMQSSDEYFGALSGLNIRKLALDYGNDLNSYTKKNEFAKVYLAKLDQFIDILLPKFMEQISEILRA